ncbi:MAG: hypothetical protein ACJAYU_000637 [Bradymonadia bacterium]|jgi:hypothetical protein
MKRQNIALACVFAFGACTDSVSDDAETDALFQNDADAESDAERDAPLDVALDADDVAEEDAEVDIDDLFGRSLNPRFDTEVAEFFATPWPSDARVLPDGSADLATFPGADEGLMLTFRQAIEGDIFGYSIMPVAYVAFDGPVGRINLPAPSTTLRPGSIAQLIDVSEEGCGTRIPIVVGLDEEGDPYRDANTLAASPVPGFALRAATPYAFVLRREFGLEAGREVVPPEAFVAALNGEGEWAQSYEPMIRCLQQDDLDLDSIGIATVFTTQDPASELRAIRDHVVSNAVDAPEPFELVLDEELSAPDVANTWRGTYQTPIYQTGASPYTTGGEFGFDDEGLPEVQRLEEVPFAVAIPTTGDGPFPLLIQMPGTGGTISGTIRRHPGIDAIFAGFAVATFAPQFHDTRAVPGSDPVIHGFNYLNPVSGRTVFRQQVIDTAYFVRVLRESLAESEVFADIDLSTLVYGGHSQGSLVGGLIAGVETEFASYVLNGTGSYISVTVVERTDPFDIQALINEVFGVGRRLDVQHPLVALVQLGTDVVEPYSFMPFYRGWAGQPSGAHMLVINGYEDYTTFPPSMNATTIGAGLAPIAPAGWDPDEYDVWEEPSEVEPPITGNATAFDGSPLTMATFLDRDSGHFTIQENEDATELAVRFWVESLTGAPVVQ